MVGSAVGIAVQVLKAHTNVREKKSCWMDLNHFPETFIFFLTCHNFFPLSSVQIIIIPACCLLCVL